jgi:hypothetical protein
MLCRPSISSINMRAAIMPISLAGWLTTVIFGRSIVAQ